jgi:hypothetical protein
MPPTLTCYHMLLLQVRWLSSPLHNPASTIRPLDLTVVQAPLLPEPYHSVRQGVAQEQQNKYSNKLIVAF